jgi:hypothetical protein
MVDWLETVEAMPVGQFSGVTAVLRVGVVDEQASAQRAAISDAILGSIGTQGEKVMRCHGCLYADRPYLLRLVG